MKFYEKYKNALESHGYTVDEHGIVRDAYGNQAAGEDRFGNVNCSDPNITAICTAEDAKPKPKPKAKKPKLEVVTEVEPIEDGD